MTINEKRVLSQIRRLNNKIVVSVVDRTVEDDWEGATATPSPLSPLEKREAARLARMCERALRAECKGLLGAVIIGSDAELIVYRTSGEDGGGGEFVAEISLELCRLPSHSYTVVLEGGFRSTTAGAFRAFEKKLLRLTAK